MPVSAMTAPGGSITPSKHILGNQDAAATNFSRSGSAVRASKKNRQIGKRGAGGEAGRAPQSGSAAVVSEWDGHRHIVVLRQQGAPSCGLETARSLLAVTAAVRAACLSQTKAPASDGRQVW